MSEVTKLDKTPDTPPPKDRIFSQGHWFVPEGKFIVAMTTAMFFASVIRSGEEWTPACQQALEDLMGMKK